MGQNVSLYLVGRFRRKKPSLASPSEHINRVAKLSFREETCPSLRKGEHKASNAVWASPRGFLLNTLRERRGTNQLESGPILKSIKREKVGEGELSSVQFSHSVVSDSLQPHE